MVWVKEESSRGVIMVGEYRRTGRRAGPVATLSTANLTWTDMGANLGCRGEKLATNQSPDLCHGCRWADGYPRWSEVKWMWVGDFCAVSKGGSRVAKYVVTVCCMYGWYFHSGEMIESVYGINTAQCFDFFFHWYCGKRWVYSLKRMNTHSSSHWAVLCVL